MKRSALVLAAVSAVTLSMAAADASAQGLPVASDPRTIPVADGDTLVLPITKVKKTIAGVERTMLAYAGSIPGPVLRVKQGSRIKIVLKNGSDQETTLHAHGLRLKNAFDGMPDVTQKPIKPGEQFTYVLDFPDSGVYWYHPHVRSWYQQDVGLAGTFVVAPKDTTDFDKVDREEVLVLDDFTTGPAPNPAVMTHAIMGHFGDVMLVNGRTDYVLRAKRGEVLRLHLVNVANARPFRFAIPGARMKLVGSEIGRPEWQTWTDGVTIGPAERYSVDVLFGNAGSFSIVNAKPTGAVKLGRVDVSAMSGGSASTRAAFWKLRENDDVQQELDPLRWLFDKPAAKKLVLSLQLAPSGGNNSGHSGHGVPTPPPSGHGAPPPPPATHGGHGGSSSPAPIEWDDAMPGMASTPSSQVVWKVVDAATGLANEKIHWTFKVGEKRVIELYNDPTSPHPMQHPIHFHGQRFLVLSEGGKVNKNLAWKDTVLVRAGDRVRILLDVSNPGQWMAHCHIPEHMAAGMEAMFDAKPATSSP